MVRDRSLIKISFCFLYEFVFVPSIDVNKNVFKESVLVPSRDGRELLFIYLICEFE